MQREPLHSDHSTVRVACALSRSFLNILVLFDSWIIHHNNSSLLIRNNISWMRHIVSIHVFQHPFLTYFFPDHMCHPPNFFPVTGNILKLLPSICTAKDTYFSACPGVASVLKNQTRGSTAESCFMWQWTWVLANFHSAWLLFLFVAIYIIWKKMVDAYPKHLGNNEDLSWREPFLRIAFQRSSYILRQQLHQIFALQILNMGFGLARCFEHVPGAWKFAPTNTNVGHTLVLETVSHKVSKTSGQLPYPGYWIKWSHGSICWIAFCFRFFPHFQKPIKKLLFLHCFLWPKKQPSRNLPQQKTHPTGHRRNRPRIDRLWPQHWTWTLKPRPLYSGGLFHYPMMPC